jgi:hypothetical protein
MAKQRYDGESLVGQTIAVTRASQEKGMQVASNQYALSHGVGDAKTFEIYRIDGGVRDSKVIAPVADASQYLSEEELARLPHYDSLPADFFTAQVR